jgi:hypothetical protein
MGVYDPEDFAARVNHAAATICRRGEATRHFDTCFEMYDGDAVAAALVRRAERTPKLAANLPRYLGESAKAAADRFAGRNLAQVARELRAAGIASRDAFFATLEAA